MMFNRLAIYTVHYPAQEADGLEKLEFVKEGFNLFAFLFHLFWALYHRCWRFALIIVLLNLAVLGVVYPLDMVLSPVTRVMQIAIQVWVGFEAADWKRAELARRHYLTYGIVSGENEIHAERRFLDRYFNARTA